MFSKENDNSKEHLKKPIAVGNIKIKRGVVMGIIEIIKFINRVLIFFVQKITEKNIDSVIRNKVASTLISLVFSFLYLFIPTNAQAVDLVLNGTKTLLSGVECAVSKYRFGTTSSYDGKQLDLILDVLEEDNDYVGPCVQLKGNQVSFYLRDEDAGDNVAYMDVKFTVVEKGTLTPVEVDRILVTNFDLDTSNLGSTYSLSDDVYYRNADGAYISNNSLVQYSEGAFYGGKYNVKMRGRKTGDCNDSTTTTDVTCRAAAIWINGENGVNKVSTIYARAQNDNAYGTYNDSQAIRLIQFSFELVHFENLVTVASDYGDAPNSYGNAGHKLSVSIGMGFGEIADNENAHQASSQANSDDNDTGAGNFDDENAVTLNGQDLNGQALASETTKNLTVKTFGSGYLSGWVDWNRDGDFNDANEQFLDDYHVTSTSIGSSTIPLNIPATIKNGNSFIRFRYTTVQGIGATGYSTNPGEVEDYQISLQVVEDHGDAPAIYGDAIHSFPATPTLYLGSIPPDNELSAKTPLDGTGDDDNATDDEDAVTILSTIKTTDSDYNLEVSCVGNGAIAAWIDFNKNNAFDSSEKKSSVCSGGKAILSWSSLSNLTVGITYLRIRIASNANEIINPIGWASDGEVEDYAINIELPNYDYGDAPDDGADFKYGIAKHLLPPDPFLFMGAKKPSKDKASDHDNWKKEWKTNGKHKGWFKNNKDRRKKGNGHRKKKDKVDPAPDDIVGDGEEEDGLVTSALSWNNGTICTGILPDGSNGSIAMSDTRYCITVKANNNSAIAAQLVGWIDFNQNGEFDDPTERSVVDVDADTSNDATQGNVPAGSNDQSIVIYWDNQTKVSGELNTFIRLRLTSDPTFKSNHSPNPIGVAINGEVEDTNIGINVTGTDYGDAPDSYGDASHVIELDAYMGTTLDNDITSQNTANGGADGVGDDNDGYNDDDGVTTFLVLATNLTSYSIDVTATTPDATDANLVGWIDFDGNGVFDTDEAATVAVPKNSTDVVATLTWATIPNDIKSGNSYVRLRLTTDTSVATGVASSSTPSGLANDGEVEDYALEIQGTVDVVKTTSTPSITAGELAEYTITVTNNSSKQVTGVSITDTPEDNGFFYHSSSVALFNTNTANGSPSRTSTVNPAAVSNPMTWGSFSIPAGDSIEITVTMNVFSGTGTYNNSVTATTTTVGAIVRNYDGSSSTGEDVTVGNALCTTTTEAKVFYGSGNGDIYSINLANGNQRMVTNTALQGFANRGLNALATNPDAGGIAYYGNGVSVYYWDPAEGSGVTSHHLLKNLSGFDQFSGGNLDSGGGSYLEGIYYVGAESSNGTIVDIFALTLSADGKSVVSAKALGVQTASGNTLGGFGDFIATSEGMSGTIYGASDVAGYWSFDIATKTYQKIAGYPGQLSTDQNGQLWRGLNAFNLFNKLTGVASGNPSYTPLAPIYDLTGPYNCPQFDTDVYDYGDAPASYGNASHLILNTPRVYIGAVLPDDETQTLLGGDAGIDADGDNAANTNDEEGVASFPELTDIDSSYELDVAVHNTSGNIANLVGWIDFDDDGVFSTDEAATLAVNSGTNGTIVKLKWNAIPIDIKANEQSYLRLRFTSDTNIATGSANTSQPVGLAADGEVEDYPIFIKVGGFPVEGRVYNDSNINGVNDDAEIGISGLPVVLVKIEANPANNTCVSTKTDGEGNYTFFPVIPGDYQLYEASQEKVTIPNNCDVTKAKDPYRSTTVNVLPQFSVIDAEVTGKDFGDVKDPLFTPDHSGTVLPGNVVFYTHKFTAKTTGIVNFSSNNSGGTTTGWSSILYQDANCNGKLDGTEANAPVAANLATTAKQNICLINKVYAPNNVATGEIYRNIINADFNFNNNALAGSTRLKVTDLTKAAANDPVVPEAGSSRLELRKTVQNIAQGTAETEAQNQAKPGDVLQYRIYYSNTGTGVITDLQVDDTVPEFTILEASTINCDTTPAGLNCSPNAANDPDLNWVFTGALKGGAKGSVSYQVMID